MPARRQSVIETSSPRRAADPANDRVAPTRARLVDAAEGLLLDHPYGDVSVRMINAAAGLNPGAVHYHFGSKEGLVVALLEHRLASADADVRARFEGFDPTAPVDLAEVVALAVDPMLELARGRARERLWAQLLVRVILEGWDVPFGDDVFSLDRWASVAARALPHLTEQVVRVRWGYATALILQQTGRVADATDRDPAPLDRDALVAFLVGGLRAP